VTDASHLWPGIHQFWGSADPDWRGLYEFMVPCRFTKAERRRLKRLQRRRRELVRQLDRNQAKQDRLCAKAKARQGEDPGPATEPGPSGFIFKRDPDNPPNPDFSYLDPPPMGLG
jgi:hypothetical protein